MRSPAHAALLWLSCARVPPWAQLPLRSPARAAQKRPSELQASRRLSWRCHTRHNPAPSPPHTHTLVRNIQAKPEPPTVALLLCRDAFYIMCASGPFHSGPLDYNRLHGKKRSLFVSLVLDRQLRATLTTFTHTDSELPRRVKYKLKLLFHTCQI